MTDSSLSQKYKKWDHIEDSDDEAEKEMQKMPTRFTPELQKVTISEVDYLAADGDTNSKEKYKRLPQTNNEIWQVVIRKLRVWSAASSGASDGPEAIPCRPHCIMVNNIYPLGQVLSRHVCDPPELFPSAKVIFDQILHTMLNPPEGIPQHRPHKIVFVDLQLVGELTKTLASLSIEASQLSESEGVDEHVKQFSDFLVRKQIASRSEMNEREGTYLAHKTNEAILPHYCEAASAFRKAKPWNSMLERQAIQVDVLEPVEYGQQGSATTVVPAGTYYYSVLGTEGSHGMGLFYSQTDLERRVLPADLKNARLEDPELQRCNFTRKTMAHTNEKLKRCTRCRSTFYVDQEAQKSDWPKHKKLCKPWKDLQPNETYWADKECSFIFETVTTLAFDDHDLFDRLNLSFEGGPNEDKYPLSLIFSKGKPDRPGPEELLLLEIGMRTITEMLSSQPEYMKRSIVYACGAEYEPFATQVSLPHTAKPVAVEVRNATVVAMHEITKFREMMKAKQQAEATKSDNHQTLSPDKEASPNASATVDDEQKQTADVDEGKNCCIM